MAAVFYAPHIDWFVLILLPVAAVPRIPDIGLNTATFCIVFVTPASWKTKNHCLRNVWRVSLICFCVFLVFQPEGRAGLPGGVRKQEVLCGS